MTRLLLLAGARATTTPAPGNTAWGDAASTHVVTTTISAAIAEAHAAKVGKPDTPANARRILVPPGVYTERLGLGGYDSIQGMTDNPADTMIKWVGGPETSREYVADVSGSVEYRNLTMWGGANSYAIHDDADSGKPDQSIARNCVFRCDYASAPFGIGTGGKEFYNEDCTFISYNGTLGERPGNGEQDFGVGYFIHMNAGAHSPSRLIFDRCEVRAGLKAMQLNEDTRFPETAIVVANSHAPDATQVEFSVGSTSTAKLYVQPEEFTIGNVSPDRVIRGVPSPIPHWTDADSPHNVLHGLYQD